MLVWLFQHFCEQQVVIISLGFHTGILRVGVSNTAPVPGKTATGTGAGTNRTITYAVFKYHRSACKPAGWLTIFCAIQRSTQEVITWGS